MQLSLFRSKKRYYINSGGLTTNELRESSLNDLRLGSITSVLVEFKSPAGVTYYTNHTRQIPDCIDIVFLGLPASSYMELFCRKKEFNEEDFAHVESALEAIAKQKFEGVELSTRFDELTDGSDYGPIRFINVNRRVLTNSRITELIDEYGNYFNNVRILRAFFQNVRESDINHLDLPSEKVAIRDKRHLHPDDWKNPLL